MRAAKNGIRIRSIWIADMWNQGQSGVLNEKIMGNDRMHPSFGPRLRGVLMKERADPADCCS